MPNDYAHESVKVNFYIVKTSFMPKVTLRKSRVERGWDLASSYVVHPCLHAGGSVFWGWSKVEVKTCHEV